MAYRERERETRSRKDASPSEGPPRPDTMAAGRERAETRVPSALPPGARAPEFSLQATLDRDVSLRQFRGRPVILVFYPADWSPVCSDQLALYNEVLPEFEGYGAQLLGISVDGVWSHRAFAKERNLRFPLLADFEPKGETARAYGAYRQQDGTSERALFVLAPEGTIHWSYTSPLDINPGADGILEALDDLKARGALHEG